jgi:hypothetical protein
MDNNHFFSIDRLVEFGLGMSMAQQMIHVMNESMQSMYVPGSIQSMPNPIAQQQIYYIALDGKPVGPLNDGELSQLISQKKVDKNTLAWMPGMSKWQPIEQIPAVLKIVALTPPPLSANI